MVDRQVVRRDAVGPVDLEEETPDVARRGVVDADRLADADGLRPVLRRRALLREPVERVPDRPAVALEERAHERPSAPRAVSGRSSSRRIATSRASGRSSPAACAPTRSYSRRERPERLVVGRRAAPSRRGALAAGLRRARRSASTLWRDRREPVAEPRRRSSPPTPRGRRSAPRARGRREAARPSSGAAVRGGGGTEGRRRR